MKELLIPFRRLVGLSPWEEKTLGFLETISDSGEVSELIGLFVRLAVVVSTVFSLVPSGNDSSFTTSCCGRGSKSERDSLSVFLVLVLKQQTVLQVILITLIETFDLAIVLHWLKG